MVCQHPFLSEIECYAGVLALYLPNFYFQSGNNWCWCGGENFFRFISNCPTKHFHLKPALNHEQRRRSYYHNICTTIIELYQYVVVVVFFLSAEFFVNLTALILYFVQWYLLPVLLIITVLVPDTRPSPTALLFFRVVATCSRAVTRLCDAVSSTWCFASKTANNAIAIDALSGHRGGSTAQSHRQRTSFFFCSDGPPLICCVNFVWTSFRVPSL